MKRFRVKYSHCPGGTKYVTHSEVLMAEDIVVVQKEAKKHAAEIHRDVYSIHELTGDSEP